MARRIDDYREMVEGKRPHPPIARLLGFRLVRIEEGLAELEMRCTEDMANSIGAVQGGMVATLADASMGMAAVALMEEGSYVSTVELKINFLRPAGMETVRAVGKVIHAGRRLVVAESEVVNEEGKLLAKAMSTLMVQKGPKEP